MLRRGEGWGWSVILNRVVEIGSQTVIWEKALEAEGMAKAIKQEQVYQV